MIQFFSQGVDNLLNKIDTYDKKNWEVIFQNYKLKSNIAEDVKVPKHSRRRLIDIDLFRGKSFKKAKPIYNFYQVTLKAILYTMLYPLFTEWWTGHFGVPLYFLFLILYNVNLAGLFIYLNYPELNNLYFHECYTYLIICVIVTQLYVHVTVKNLTRPIKLKVPIPENKLSVHGSLDDLKISSTNYKSDEPSPTPRLPAITQDRPCLSGSETEIDKCYNRTKSKSPVIIYSESDESTQEIEARADDFNQCNDVFSSSYCLADPHPVCEDFQPDSEATSLKDSLKINYRAHVQQEVVVTYFTGKQVKTAKISIWEIVELLKERVDEESKFTKYDKNYIIYIIIALYFSALPIIFRIAIKTFVNKPTIINIGSKLILGLLEWFKESSTVILLEIFLVSISRFVMIMCYFILIFAAEKTFIIRSLFAKYFCALTSSRRSRRRQLPHFRLNNVKNIKAWLALRSYLRRSGPVRSIEIIVSSAVAFCCICIFYLCVKYLMHINDQKADERFIDEYLNWEFFSWTFLLSSFVFRFVSYNKEINSRYNNKTELLAEQLNLYLQLDINPQKKHHYSIANNVLKLASDLIKEIEEPRKATLLMMNPLLRNIFHVLLLSLVSGVLSELFGVSLKFWKIKA